MRLLVLSLLLLMPAQSLLAQASTAAALGPEELDYYLLQSLNAAGADSRLPLNHIGIQVIEQNDGYLVTAVLEGYPAQAAGIYRGDLIRQADGEAFHPVHSFNEAHLAPAGFRPFTDNSRLLIQRGDSEITATVSPVFENLYDSYRSATLNSLQQFPSGNKTVAYLRLWVLSRATDDLIAYQSLFDQLAGSDGLILDLRDSLGFLDLAQLQLIYRGASELFQASDSAVQAELLPEPEFQLPALANPYRNPVAILVNEYSRGGAELLAWQLDKLNRVITLGKSTAGELGNWQFQNGLIRYQPRAGLLIDGIEVEGEGFAPEREADYPQTRAGRIDPQFQAAMDLLMGII
jgi:carboxyl-terminal processing protease